MASDRAMKPKAPLNMAKMRNVKSPLAENACAMVSTEKGVTFGSTTLISLANEGDEGNGITFGAELKRRPRTTLCWRLGK